MELKTALVVDDSKVARFGLIKILRKRGLEVDFAESGQQALDYLKTNKPDVIFMDYFMPGMDGPDATRAIRSNNATALIPVIMCTSKESAEDQESARSAGVDGFMIKPATLKILDLVLTDLSKHKASNDAHVNVLAVGTTAPTADLLAATPSLEERAALTPLPLTHQQVETLAVSTASRIAEKIATELGRQTATTVAKQIAATVGRETALDCAQQVSKDIATAIAHQCAKTTATEIARKASIDAVQALEASLQNQWQHQLNEYVQGEAFLALIEAKTRDLVKNIAQNTAKQFAAEQTQALIEQENQKTQVILGEMLNAKVGNEFHVQKIINSAFLATLVIGSSLWFIFRYLG